MSCTVVASNILYSVRGWLERDSFRYDFNGFNSTRVAATQNRESEESPLESLNLVHPDMLVANPLQNSKKAELKTIEQDCQFHTKNPPKKFLNRACDIAHKSAISMMR